MYEIEGVETINEKLNAMQYFRLIMSNDDYSDYTIFRAEAKFIGIISNNRVLDAFFVAKPGAYLYNASVDNTKE